MVIRTDPKEFVLNESKGLRVLEAVESLYGPIVRKNNLQLQRGPYTVVAVMDESQDVNPLRLEGQYIDLYDPTLPVLNGITIEPGRQKLLYDLKKRPSGTAILAEAGRSYDIQRKRHSLSYTTKGPAETVNRSRISIPSKPSSVEAESGSWEWDESSKTLLLEFPNNPDGVSVLIRW